MSDNVRLTLILVSLFNRILVCPFLLPIITTSVDSAELSDIVTTTLLGILVTLHVGIGGGGIGHRSLRGFDGQHCP